MNIVSTIPYSQNYPNTFDEVYSLDNKGRLYLPVQLLNFIMPYREEISLGLYEVFEDQTQYLVGFITKRWNDDIPRLLERIKGNVNTDDYALISLHKIDLSNRVILREKLEDFFSEPINSVRLRGMETHFTINQDID